MMAGNSYVLYYSPWGSLHPPTQQEKHAVAAEATSGSSSAAKKKRILGRPRLSSCQFAYFRVCFVAEQ